MKILLFIVAFVSVISSESTVTAAENDSFKVVKIQDRPLIPTGLGLTRLHEKDVYLGRLSVDTAAIYRTPEDLVYMDAARRMEFKFVSEKKISGKTFARQLMLGIKINNEKEALRDNTGDIGRFRGFFTRTIIKGDIVRFDYHPKTGTRIYHNKRLLGEVTESREFYRFLLNMWLGDRPPSAKFKSGLLGQNGDEYQIELQRRYDSL